MIRKYGEKPGKARVSWGSWDGPYRNVRVTFANKSAIASFAALVDPVSEDVKRSTCNEYYEF